MRILLMLKTASTTAFSSEKIAFLDFVSTYGAVFDISDKNLHGFSPYVFSEYSLRRELIINNLGLLSQEGLVKLSSTKNGLLYNSTKKGVEITSTFNSEYGNEYVATVYKAINKFSNTEDQDLIKIISDKAVTTIRGIRCGNLD